MNVGRCRWVSRNAARCAANSPSRLAARGPPAPPSSGSPPLARMPPFRSSRAGGRPGAGRRRARRPARTLHGPRPGASTAAAPGPGRDELRGPVTRPPARRRRAARRPTRRDRAPPTPPGPLGALLAIPRRPRPQSEGGCTSTTRASAGEWRPTKWCNFRAARTLGGRASGRLLACHSQLVRGGTRVALARSDVTHVLEATRAGGDIDVIRERGGGARAPGPHRRRSSRGHRSWPQPARQAAPDTAQR